jgi:hypothetical protein
MLSSLSKRTVLPRLFLLNINMNHKFKNYKNLNLKYLLKRKTHLLLLSANIFLNQIIACTTSFQKSRATSPF